MASRWMVLTVVAATAIGCATGDDGEIAGPGPGKPADPQRPEPVAPGAQRPMGGFVSDDPGYGSTMTPLMAADSAEVGTEASQTIAEADVIQLAGDRLYALSRYAGLSVVDVSNPDALKVVARRPASGTPFEMYLVGDVLVTMAAQFGQSVVDDRTGGYSWVESSRVEAIDVKDIASLKTLASLDLPGALSDSRMVGDVLYIVTFEDGQCWSCKDVPSTTVTSLSLAAPASMTLVDQLSFSEPSGAWSYGWKRSISVNDQRMYVAGIEWDGAGAGHSTIQVVDLANRGGKLALGATIQAAGQIESRWQMDEHEGVLRVVSQPGVWETDAPPRIQTFGVISADELLPLAEVALVLPKPERLRAVRFDGNRGYAITSEQKDPLFTIDLTLPTAPQQVGELEMPGWIHHIEPRGDRLVTLGFDQDDPDGSLHLSLFDVTTLATPIMLKREAFGGDWSELPEDQDRIHKALEIVDDLGLVLVPFSSFDYEMGCGSGRTDAVQLFDWKRNELTRRGIAETRGLARRALIHGGRLLATSDFGIKSFDVTDRDSPLLTSAVGLAAHVDAAVSVGDHVARLPGTDWTGGALLEIVSAGAPGEPDPIGIVDLEPVLTQPGAPSKDGYGMCPMGTAGARLFANAPFVYVAAPIDWQSTRVVVVDASVPSLPKVMGHVDVAAPLVSGLGGWGWYGGVPSAGTGVAQIGSTLVFVKEDEPTSWQEPLPLVHARLFIVDLANPAQPFVAATHQLPDAIGHTALSVVGDTVLTSRWEPVAEQPGKVRFWLDRISVAKPSSPIAAMPVNVPGSLVAFDAPSDNALLLDFVREVERDVTQDECWKLFGGMGRFDGPMSYDGSSVPGSCEVTHRVFKLAEIGDHLATMLDQLDVEDDAWISQLYAGDDRVFATDGGQVWPMMDAMVATDAAFFGPGGSQRVLAIGGIRAGALESSWIDVGGAQAHAARGRALVMSSWSPPSLLLLDANEIESSVVSTLAELHGSPYSVSVEQAFALCSMGPYGLESIALPTDR